MKEVRWGRRNFILFGLLTGCIGMKVSTLWSKQLHGDEILNIISFPDPVLRRIARPVTRFDNALAELSRNMLLTLKNLTHKGLLSGGFLSKGLAAPQVGVSKRIIISSLYGTVQVMVNPEIITKKGSYFSREGCLSLPNHARRVVKRSQEILVYYCDIHGNDKEIVLKQRFAAALEHEVDHLNGVLYIDKPQAS